MDRSEIFMAYYKMLNDYVILNELLYAKNKKELFRWFTHSHKCLVKDNENKSDEIFLASMEIERKKLLFRYVTLLDNYFTMGLETFGQLRRDDKKVDGLYKAIVSHICDADRQDGAINLETIINHLEKIEKSADGFVALKNKAK